jgi:hypothetical protein
VYFPDVVLSMDISIDCHLSYEPLGKSVVLSSLHYVQPWCPPVLYPSESSAFRAHMGVDPLPKLHLSGNLVLIEDGGSNTHGACGVNNGPPPSTDDMVMDLPTFIYPVPKQARWAKTNTFSVDDLALTSRHLQFLLDWLSSLPVLPPPPSNTDPVAPKLLLSLSNEEVVQLVHCLGSILPPVCPCDRSNGFDTKIHWTLEKLHPALGCRCFRNYKHIVKTSLDGQWIDGGVFLLLLGTFTTIPKAPCGGAIDCKQSLFLDVVHVDIAFGDCVLVGGFRHSLIFADQATHYNWVFGLKDLSDDSILAAFHLFQADASSYAWCFWCDCDAKLFETKIQKHLINNDPNIIAAVAGRQSSNTSQTPICLTLNISDTW